MKDSNRHVPRARFADARVFLVLAVLASAETGAQAAPVPLTQSDVALAIYAPDGNSWRALDANDLNGFFGAHRCDCPDKLLVQLGLTTSGQTNLGSSTLAVDFLLGENCPTAPVTCLSVGQVTFTATQSAESPTFDSGQVFQAVAGTSTVDCANLIAGTTTLWAVIAQDGVTLSFAPAIDLPVIATTVAAPTAVTALTANQGLLVTWTPPADTSLVAGYQVLCLPPPAVAASPAYESCGLDSTTTAGTILTPADESEVCSAEVSAGTTQVRLAGLVNGTPYTVAVVAIDPSGGVSALSPQAVATPAPTVGFFEKYREDGGAAAGCSLSGSPPSGRTSPLWWVLAAAVVFPRRNGRRKAREVTRIVVLVLALSASARAQDLFDRGVDDWSANSPATGGDTTPDWGFEFGISLYRPDVDGEFSNGTHPFADTFSSSRHVMTEAELDRYLGHRYGSWGVGLRGGYYKVTGAAFQGDGVTRSGDETSLRLIPLSLSAMYKADGLAGLRSVPLVPYLKAGLDVVMWTGASTGNNASHTGLTPGWHVAGGMALGLNSLGLGAVKPGAVAGPGSLFFEWDYAAINGLGLGGKLHVGDSTWFAGVMFDL